MLVLAGVAGCGNSQSTLSPHSEPARQITTLWWGMLAAAAVGFGGTLLLIAIAYVRRNRAGLPIIDGDDDRNATRLVVAFGIIIPLLALTTLFFIADIGVVRATDAPGPGQTRLTIDVAARQWFWDVRYARTSAVTANEIHIPTGTPVKVELTSPDVIHSFWVPELNKKVDAIPGHPNSLLLEADKPGVYRGQCAEFCGLQHANMALAVHAEPPAKFKAWLAHMAKPVSASAPGAAAGLRAFNADQCAACHTLRGTSAHGRIGPDLTHVMSRHTLAALTIPNTKDYLGAWIVDPQHFKPGNEMPALRVKGADLAKLTTFLGGLK
jgi:cytochrome c oxidase subunit 2